MRNIFALVLSAVLLFGGTANADKDGMNWLLFKITVAGEAYVLDKLGDYRTMIGCFEAWSEVEKSLPKPKIDVQIICVRSSEAKELS